MQVKIFHELLDQLFDFIEANFADFRSDIALSKASVNFLKKSNPRLVVEQFMLYVLPYSEYINSCDENFFLNFDKNINDVSSDSLLTGMKIKQVWLSNKITNDHKAYLWYYFQQLLKTGHKVVS